MTIQIGTYPDYLEQIKKLIDQHLELVEEPLLMAIYYAPDRPGREEDDVFLFEVLDNFDGSSLETDGDMLEVLYDSSRHFTMHHRDARLHIILTSPEELRKATAKNTQRILELKQAMAKHRAQIVYIDPLRADLKQVFQ